MDQPPREQCTQPNVCRKTTRTPESREMRLPKLYSPVQGLFRGATTRDLPCPGLHLRREWHGGVEHSEVLSSAEVCGLISVSKVLREAFKVVSEAFKGSCNAPERDMQVQLR